MTCDKRNAPPPPSANARLGFMRAYSFINNRILEAPNTFPAANPSHHLLEVPPLPYLNKTCANTCMAQNIRSNKPATNDSNVNIFVIIMIIFKRFMDTQVTFSRFLYLFIITL